MLFQSKFGDPCRGQQEGKHQTVKQVAQLAGKLCLAMLIDRNHTCCFPLSGTVSLKEMGTCAPVRKIQRET